MMYHVHIGAIHALIVILYFIPFAALWRFVATSYSDTELGKAMAFIF